jgi:hypothetical protein
MGMSEEYGFNVLNLKSNYDPHSYLLGRFYQTKDTEEEARLIYKIIMLFEDLDLEEIGIERNCLNEVIENIIDGAKRKTWPSYAYRDDEGYFYDKGEKLVPNEWYRRQRDIETKREIWISSTVYPIAIKIWNFLNSHNVQVPVDIIGEPIKKPEVVEA